MENNIDFELNINVKCKSDPKDPSSITAEFSVDSEGLTSDYSLTVVLALVVKKVFEICKDRGIPIDNLITKIEELVNTEDFKHPKELGITDPPYSINIDPKNLNA